MATGSILIDEGATTHLPTYTFTEDAVTKEVGRAVLNNSSGTEIGTNANPLQIGDAGGSLTVDGTVAATQSGTWNVTNISGTVSLPTGAATSANQTTANSSLSSIDGKITACNTGAVTVASSALPTGAATAAKQPALGTAGTASADVITVQGIASMTALRVDGSAVTQPVSAASLPLPTGASTEATLSSLNGKVTACNTGAVTISAALPAGTNNIGDVDVLTLPALPTGSNTIGAVNLAQYTPASGRLPVDGSGVTQPISGTITANAGTGTFTAAGVTSHDSPVSGNPNLIGLEARTSRPTAVQNGDLVRGNADVYGRARTITPNVTQASSNGTPITTATNTSAVAAPSAGNHLRIYRLWAQNSSATGTWLYWTEGSGGVKRYPMYLAQNQIVTVRLNGEWELPSATALFINTATTGANIEWHVGHETVID